MDEIIKPLIISTEPAVTTEVQPPMHKKRLLIWIVIAIVALALIGGTVWYFTRHHKKTLTPTQTLQALEKSSKPVTATPTQRAAVLLINEKRSTPVKVSSQDRITMLNALKK
jgi:flagellar basal body-associated protein FliL